MDKIKVLVVAPVPFFVDRGTPMRILEESLALEKNNLEINIVTYHLGRNVKDIASSSVIKVSRVPGIMFWYKKEDAGPSWQKILLDVILIWKVFRNAFLKKPEIIHAHLHEGALVGWIVKKMLFWRKIKLVTDFHGGLVSEMESHGYLNGGFLKKVFLFLEKFIFSLGDKTIVSSIELKEKINQIDREKEVIVVMDGVNIGRYDLKNKMNNEGKMKVVYSGAFVKNKGINMLLETILEMKKMGLGDRISFILAGRPAENIEGFLKENNLSDIVEVISPLDYSNLPEINMRGDIGIDLKTSEVGQASGKILHYMAAGLPVVCFDRSNNREYLGEGGYYVKEKNPKKVAEAILMLSNSPEKILSMSEISRERSKFFSWEKSAQKIINIYKEI